jgi:two-component system, NarL family, sensor histidine kinase UhpB
MSSTATAAPAPSAPVFSETLRTRIRAPWRDAAIVFAATAVAAVLCIRFDVSEMVQGFTAPWESVQLDELPGILLVLAIALAWFAARRYREAGRELRRRCLAEERVAAALADNRRLSQEYVRLQESERKGLAQELHDELGQYLNVIKLDAVGLRDLRLESAAALRERAVSIVENCDHIHRALGALIRQLRPVGLDELGLAAAVEHCVDTWQARLPGTQLHLSVTGDLSQLPEAGCLTVYRLVQEALTNVAKHALAAHVVIELARTAPEQSRGDAVEVTVADDGPGADLSAQTSGLGLIGMRERVAALDGTLEVTSSRGRGFRLKARIPVGRP